MRTDLLLLIVAAGCGGPGEDLSAALPDAERLTLALPGSPAAKAAAGAPAELYVVARRTSEQLNGLVGSVVGRIAGVVREAPATWDGERELWGPVTPALSPLSYRVLAERGPEPGSPVAYHLDARPKDGSGDWTVIVAGGAAVDGHAGRADLDLASLRALDPAGSVGPASALSVGYDLGPRSSALRLRLDGADYGYGGAADGSGAIVLATGTGVLRARWLGSGAGRAELGAVVECWYDAFHRVYLAGPDGTAGDPGACPDVP